MNDFKPDAPQILRSFQRASASGIDTKYLPSDIHYEDVERLISATPRDLAGHPFLYCSNFFTINTGERIEFDTNPNDLYEMQRVLNGALDILRISDSAASQQGNDLFTLISLAGCDAAELHNEALGVCEAMGGETPEDVRRLAAGCGTYVCPVLHIDISSSDAPDYAAFLKRAAKASNECETSEYPALGRLHITSKAEIRNVFPDTPAGHTDAFKRAFDLIASLHLSDIRTVSINGGKEWRESKTGVSMAWWLLLDHLRTGRVGVCEECGRPFITGTERGNPRRFCSKRCQMRTARRKKGQTPPKGGLDSKGDAGTGKEERRHER